MVTKFLDAAALTREWQLKDRCIIIHNDILIAFEISVPLSNIRRVISRYAKVYKLDMAATAKSFKDKVKLFILTESKPKDIKKPYDSFLFNIAGLNPREGEC